MFRFGRDFGFGSNFDKENDGKKSLKMTTEMAEFFTTIDLNKKYSLGHFYDYDKDLYGTYGSYPYDIDGNTYKCDFYVGQLTYGDGSRQIYVLGQSGSHGFFGGQYTQRETIATAFVKKINDQLIKKLNEKCKELEDIALKIHLETCKWSHIDDYCDYVNGNWDTDIRQSMKEEKERILKIIKDKGWDGLRKICNSFNEVSSNYKYLEELNK